MPYVGYVFILLVCCAVTLVAFGKLARYHALVLYVSGLGLLLMTTLAGPNLIGSDIHLEWYYAQLAMGGNVLPPVIGTPQGTSVLSYLTPSVWVYKLVCPALFAFVPVMLYKLFKRWSSPRQAFMGAFLIIAFPAFFMELPTIPKQAVAEFCMVGGLYLSANHLSFRWYPQLWPMLVACGIAVPLLHYSTAILGVIIAATGSIVSRLVNIPLWKPLLVFMASIILVGVIYFPLAENAAVLRKVTHLYNSSVPTAWEVDWLPIETIDSDATPKEPVKDANAPNKPFFQRYESLLRSGLGFDFMQVNAWGKMFRMLQWAIILLLVVGLWKLRRKREYWVFAGGTVVLVGLCLVPGFASILNSTRLLHVALLLLALPVAVSLKPQYLLLLLIPYFLFTSGFVFEVTNQSHVAEISIPYSVALTNHRIDLGASISPDDATVRDYIVDNNLYPICSDIWGTYFIIERTGDRPDILREIRDVHQIEDGSYLFLRSRNSHDGTFMVWNGIGLRRAIDLNTLGVDIEANIVFQSGDARVIRVEP